MARAGRKRKDVARLAGRRDWRQLVEDPSLLTKWSRYRDRISELGGNPKLASQAGKLHYLRQLTTLEAEAAERWSRMLDENYRLVLGMARTPPSVTLERFSRGGGHPDRPDEVQRFLDRFNAAQDAILRVGKPALAALNRLCCDEASSSVLGEARRGLAQLIVHFHLDSQRSGGS
jgi:hypothetical protein